MTGLNKIIEKIISEAHDHARATVEQARKRCIEISNEYAEQCEKEKLLLKEKAENEARSIISQSKSSVMLDKKNSLLKIKSELVDEAFRQAREEIENLPDGKYEEIIASLAATAIFELIETQKENLEKYGESPDTETYELLLNKKDHDRCGKAVYAMLCEKTASKFGKAAADKLSLSEKTVNIDGGAVIRCGNVENNASFSRLFAVLKEKLEFEVASYLFAETNSAE